MKANYTLYLIADSKLADAGRLPEAVEQAILGGCTMVQLREKQASSLEFYMRSMKVKEITDKYNIPLIINDRIDIALAVGAAGVHIGQTDLPARAVRKLFSVGPEPGDKGMLLGVSVTSIEEAKAAEEDGADYLGVGAMFSTQTKPDAALVTFKELQEIRRAVRLPIVVIGGIGRENAALFRPMGINGLAVASAILSAPDRRKAAAELKDLFNVAKKRKI